MDFRHLAKKAGVLHWVLKKRARELALARTKELPFGTLCSLPEFSLQAVRPLKPALGLASAWSPRLVLLSPTVGVLCL